MEEAAEEGVDTRGGEGKDGRGEASEHVPFCIAQIEVEIMHTECAERTSVIVRVQRIQRLQYFEYLMPPAKLCFVLAADSSTTTSRYPVKWLLFSSNSLAACQCLSRVTCRSSPALTLTATLMQCSRCQRVLCVLYHIPCYVIQRPQGRKRRRGGAWQGEGGTAAAFNVRSWQWNNIKLCLYICNAAAASPSFAPPAACAARAP